MYCLHRPQWVLLQNTHLGLGFLGEVGLSSSSGSCVQHTQQTLRRYLSVDRSQVACTPPCEA